MTCPNCGGTMIGDGYTIVKHCENVDIGLDVEPDASPIYCKLYETVIIDMTPVEIILVNNNRPILFVASDINENLYLFNLTLQLNNYDNFIGVNVIQKDLDLLYDDKLSVKEILTLPSINKIFLINILKYDILPYRAFLMTIKQLPDFWIPNMDHYPKSIKAERKG